MTLPRYRPSLYETFGTHGAAGVSAALTALPPSANTSRPTRLAIGLFETTIPCVDRTSSNVSRTGMSAAVIGTEIPDRYHQEWAEEAGNSNWPYGSLFRWEGRGTLRRWLPTPLRKSLGDL